MSIEKAVKLIAFQMLNHTHVQQIIYIQNVYILASYYKTQHPKPDNTR